MPISSTYDRSKDLTVFTATGVLTFDEHMAVLRDLYKDHPTRNVLWDMRGMTGERLSSDELRRMISFIKLHEVKRPGGKTAIVTSTDLDFGLSRMSDALGESEQLPWRIRGFRSMEEAVKWLEE